MMCPSQGSSDNPALGTQMNVVSSRESSFAALSLSQEELLFVTDLGLVEALIDAAKIWGKQGSSDDPAVWLHLGCHSLHGIQLAQTIVVFIMLCEQQILNN